MPASRSFSDSHSDCILPDSVMAQAYEALTDKERALLKKCIARLHVVWGEHALRHKEVKQFRQCFSMEMSSTPAPFALFVCPAKYASPAAFLAGVLPAMLAGVAQIVPFFVTEEQQGEGGGAAPNVSPFLLAAMELAGIEEIFAGSWQQAVSLAASLTKEYGASGRVSLFGQTPCMEGIVKLAAEYSLPLRFFPEIPYFYDTGLHTVTEQRMGKNKAVEEVVCEGIHAFSKESMQLFLDEAHKDIWIWPDLGPDAFRVHRMKIWS